MQGVEIVARDTKGTNVLKTILLDDTIGEFPSANGEYHVTAFVAKATGIRPDDSNLLIRAWKKGESAVQLNGKSYKVCIGDKHEVEVIAFYAF
jgi:hypothetical protein